MTETALVPVPGELAARGERALAVTYAEKSPAAVYLARLSEGSRRTFRQCLFEIAAIARLLWGDERTCSHETRDAKRGRRIECQLCDPILFPWAALRYEHTAAIRAHLVERLAASTANKHLAALRGVLREAWRLGQIGAEEYHRAIDLRRVKGSRLPRGRQLSYFELHGLYAACEADKSAAGRRDAALIAVLHGAGLRRAEAVSLDVSDVDFAGGWIRVRGKGNKEREVPPMPDVFDAIRDWLAVRGEEHGPLFFRVNKGGKIAAHRMTADAVFLTLRKRAQQARLESFSPHDLRRTFASNVLSAGEDLSTTQKLMGHASPITTERYDRRPSEKRKEATSKLRSGYKG